MHLIYPTTFATLTLIILLLEMLNFSKKFKKKIVKEKNESSKILYLSKWKLYN
jgi:hypothetical protein